MSWAAAFVLTVAVEVPLVLWLVGRGRRRRAGRDAVVANLLTHPAAWWVVRSAILPWWIAELVVACVEAVVYRSVTRLSIGRAVSVSLLSNGITAALSFVV